MDEKRLIELKEQVDSIKTELAIKESKQSDLFKEIKENYGIKTISKIKDRLKEIEKSLENLENRKETLSEKIEKKLKSYE